MALFFSALSGLLLYCTVFGRRGADWLFECMEYHYNSLSHGMHKTAEETALESSSAIDTRAFIWTFNCFDEDHELERFFSGLPGRLASATRKLSTILFPDSCRIKGGISEEH